MEFFEICLDHVKLGSSNINIISAVMFYNKTGYNIWTRFTTNIRRAFTSLFINQFINTIAYFMWMFRFALYKSFADK